MEPTRYSNALRRGGRVSAAGMQTVIPGTWDERLFLPTEINKLSLIWNQSSCKELKQELPKQSIL